MANTSGRQASNRTIGQWLHNAEDRLAQAGVFLGHGTDNYWDEALHLALPTLDIGFDADRAVLDEPLPAEQQQVLDELLRRRIEGREPVPYLTGVAWFAGMPFQVTRDVLIPRSPVAELVEEGFQPWFQRRDAHGQLHADVPDSILDLCCGSGCIGIACAEYLPECRVDLADLSPAALAVARENVQHYGLEARVRLLQGDLFEAVPPGTRYDVIVCNPPYVDAFDMAHLPPEYLHEPQLALAAGEDGLSLVRRILSGAAEYLNDGGLLVVEVGNSWVALEQHYPQLPFTWPEFMRGGDGVFLLYKEQLAGV